MIHQCFFPARYPADTAESFCNGHASAFAFFGGIPVSALHDNTRLVVAKILGDGTGKHSALFAALHSHYVFEDRYGRAMTKARSGGGGLSPTDLYGVVSLGP